MSHPSFKTLVVAMAFALVFFVAAPKRLFAHAATPAPAKALSLQEPQGEQSNQDAEDQAGREDLNDDHQEATDDDKDMDGDKQEDENEANEQDTEANEMQAANDHDDANSVDEDRAEDQQDDTHEDADSSGIL